MSSLGAGVGVVGTASNTSRIGTKSSYDFAYWASTFVADGQVRDYSDMGAETDGVSLITWAAEQIGLTFPDTYSKAVAACTSHITVDQALKTRGSLLISPDRFAVTLCLDDVIDVVNGRYFVYRMKDSQRANWNTGAKLPGAIY